MNPVRVNIAAYIIAFTARVIGGKVFSDRLRDILTQGFEADIKPKGPAPTLNPDWSK